MNMPCSERTYDVGKCQNSGKSVPQAHAAIVAAVATQNGKATLQAARLTPGAPKSMQPIPAPTQTIGAIIKGDAAAPTMQSLKLCFFCLLSEFGGVLSGCWSPTNWGAPADISSGIRPAGMPKILGYNGCRWWRSWRGIGGLPPPKRSPNKKFATSPTMAPATAPMKAPASGLPTAAPTTAPIVAPSAVAPVTLIAVPPV